MSEPDGEQLKARGMALAEAAVESWSSEARDAIDYLARRGLPFTSEDVIRLIGLPRGKVGRDANNAVGAVMAGAAKRGVIVQVGHRNAKRASSHAARLALWEGAPE